MMVKWNNLSIEEIAQAFVTRETTENPTPAVILVQILAIRINVGGVGGV